MTKMTLRPRSKANVLTERPQKRARASISNSQTSLANRKSTPKTPASSISLFSLPLEIRQQIYGYVFNYTRVICNITHSPVIFYEGPYLPQDDFIAGCSHLIPHHNGFLQVSKQCYIDPKDVYFSKTAFYLTANLNQTKLSPLELESLCAKIVRMEINEVSMEMKIQWPKFSKLKELTIVRNPIEVGPICWWNNRVTRHHLLAVSNCMIAFWYDRSGDVRMNESFVAAMPDGVEVMARSSHNFIFMLHDREGDTKEVWQRDVRYYMASRELEIGPHFLTYCEKIELPPHEDKPHQPLTHCGRVFGPDD